MGWLFMSRGGMSPFATPKAYLDNQCTYPPDADKGRETAALILAKSLDIERTLLADLSEQEQQVTRAVLTKISQRFASF